MKIKYDNEKLTETEVSTGKPKPCSNKTEI